MKILKKDLNKLLVEERKKSKLAQKESKFKSRTLSIFKNQIVRAKEFGKEVQYSLEEFRSFVKDKLNNEKCEYCKEKITITKFNCDHKIPVSRGGDFTLENNAIVCPPCNFRKGTMTNLEFEKFIEFLYKTFESEVVSDIFRRLTAGGKWSH